MARDNNVYRKVKNYVLSNPKPLGWSATELSKILKIQSATARSCCGTLCQQGVMFRRLTCKESDNKNRTARKIYKFFVVGVAHCNGLGSDDPRVDSVKRLDAHNIFAKPIIKEGKKYNSTYRELSEEKHFSINKVSGNRSYVDKILSEIPKKLRMEITEYE